MDEKEARAIQCAKDVVARGHMCGGCYNDHLCKVSSRFALRNYRNALKGPRQLDKQERRRIERTINRLEKRLES